MAVGRQGRDRLHPNQGRAQWAWWAELSCMSKELSSEVFSLVQTSVTHTSWDKFPTC